ncbi:MAG: type II toxin-antitoxin system MqsR family toxin [Crocinitomicaceae bacterium]|nr:type II toxin-antitoxin system MqsR family toxin [Crocinitomicaceae bacterium]
MVTKSEVEAFLNTFKAKIEVFDVIFLNRDKNHRALIDLEMTSVNRKELLKELRVEDYFRGPTKDVDNGPDLWEFGRLLKQKEVYIKITIGMMNKPVICISFHLAERAIAYPFKK